MAGWLDLLWRETPWAGVGLVLSTVAAVGVVALSRRRGADALVAGGWVLALGLVVTMTMTPGFSWRPNPTVVACAADSWAPLSLGSLLAFDQRAANVLLLVPLGLLAVLLRPRPVAAAALAVTVAMPFVAELTQYLVPSLGRVCDSEDLVDNLTGVVVGVVLGVLLPSVRGRRAEPVAAAGQEQPALR
ncbi:VanZ family protein [Cellulomonas massiliensis]|uniref:VanZ family protein n=1 Tax=Cellulomonas massiliensis TaxID=1465811 RepID=UPI0002FF28D7|nr:VanZ family protein [Cellulomonas massiliensis]